MSDVPLTGVKNARDIGGISTDSGAVVRPLRLLRTARLNRPTDADLAWLASIGLRTVVDLRQSFEVTAWPDQLGDLPVERVNVAPSLDSEGAGTFFELYLAWLDDSGAGLRRRRPRAGRARRAAGTGALHGGQGPDRGAGGAGAGRARGRGEGDRRGLPDLDARLSADPGDVTFQHVISEELISGSLAHVRERYGSAEGYLLAHGVSEEEIAACGGLLGEEGSARSRASNASRRFLPPSQPSKKSPRCRSIAISPSSPAATSSPSAPSASAFGAQPSGIGRPVRASRGPTRSRSRRPTPPRRPGRPP